MPTNLVTLYIRSLFAYGQVIFFEDLALGKLLLMRMAKTRVTDLARRLPAEIIQRRIYVIRTQKVMIDSDLAKLYEVATFNLNKAVKRNLSRFPEDFMFQLTAEEAECLRFQNGISKNRGRGGGDICRMRSPSTAW